MHDDKNIMKKSKLDKQRVLQLLAALDDGERQKRARQRHVTVAYAQRWCDWIESPDALKFDNPPGYMNWAIKNKQEPPTQQIALPAGSLDLTAPPPAPDDLDALWIRIESDLRHQMTKATFDTVIAGSRLYRENGHYVVAAGSDYAKAWLENRYSPTIKRALSSAIGSEVKLKFELQEQALRGQENN